MSITLRAALAAELGDQPWQNQVAVELDDAVGAVVGGCIAVLGPDLSQQARQDVVNSLLFAQLAANAQADRHTKWVEWNREYAEVLAGVGWVTQRETSMVPWYPSGPFVLSVPVMDTFAEHSGDYARLQVSGPLEIFRNDLGNFGHEIFERQSHSVDTGNFQVALATATDDGLRIRIARFMFESKDVVRLALQKLPASTRLYAGLLDVVLDDGIYGRARNVVISRLKERYGSNVALFALPRIPAPSGLQAPGAFDRLGYDPGDPFGDLTATEAPARSLWQAVPPPVIESVVVDERGAYIRLSEELTVEPDYLYIVLETPSHITWWKSITLYTVRVPPGADPRWFAPNVQFLVQGVLQQGFTESEERAREVECEQDSEWEQEAAIDNPNAQRIGRIETKDNTHQATFRVEPWMLDGNEVHIEFHKGGFGGFAAHIPIEFWVRGGQGKRYTFRWLRD